jgi:hypothetical protein
MPEANNMRKETLPTPKTLPRDLSERKALHQAGLVVQELLFEPIPNGQPRPWRPSQLLAPGLPCPEAPKLYVPSASAMDCASVAFPNPLGAFNLKMADIACAVPELASALRIAGLRDEDFSRWESHRNHAWEVRGNPEDPPQHSSHYYVRAKGYLGIYSDPAFDHYEDDCRRRLSEASSLIQRLRDPVDRIMRTVSPEAVLSRLWVKDDRKLVTFDGVDFNVLAKSEGRYLYYLRLGAGEWVAGPCIAEREGRVEFKVKRAQANLARRNPKLRKIVEVDGDGSRIVLPLAARSP